MWVGNRAHSQPDCFNISIELVGLQVPEGSYLDINIMRKSYDR